MSNYQFAPSPTFGRSEHPFVTWNGAFSDEDIARVIEIGEKRATRPATIGSGAINSDIRSSEVAWFPCDDETRWIYDKLAHVARQLNGQFYGFDLYGFSEDMQFTTYRAEGTGHYTWHRDCMSDGSAPRKLSIVVQLSDPSEYEGGDLEVYTEATPTAVEKCKGRIAAFPSYTLHRVTPVTKGVRRSLVVWVTGPSFV